MTRATAGTVLVVVVAFVAAALAYGSAMLDDEPSGFWHKIAERIR